LLWLYGPFFSFLILYTVGRTPRTGDQPVARLLPTHRMDAHNADIRALSRIRTHDLRVRANEDRSCLKPRGRCARSGGYPTVCIQEVPSSNLFPESDCPDWDVRTFPACSLSPFSNLSLDLGVDRRYEITSLCVLVHRTLKTHGGLGIRLHALSWALDGD
jgi:hypothetical protein